MRGARPGLRVVAGNPTAEELAVVVVALGDLAGHRRGTRPAARPAPAWARAARREALGARPLSCPHDLLGPA